ncbi:MAG: PspC domain-containing protein [Chitinophagales bacterium]
MNKLLYVNIGGVVFQIDESAYKKLDNYLNSIRKKYSTVADGDEIITDIENRIAELFHEKVGERGAITSEYVDEIITVMGKPEEFENENASQQKSHHAPEEERRHRATKFYRDKENDLLGGVCAGFAAKFNIDALWIRIAFLIAFLFFGTGLLLYIILWIIIPEARTTSEKIEMRGDKVDISNIEKTIKEEAAQFKNRMKDFGNEVKETFTGERMERTKKNAGDFIESAVETLKPLIRSILKIFVFIVLIGCLVIVAALAIELFFNWGNNFSDVHFIGNHVTNGGSQAWLLVTCAIALVVIPLIGIIFSSIKYLVGIKKKTNYVSTTLGILWTGCLIALIFLGITIGRNFRYEGNISNKVDLIQPLNNTLFIQLDGETSHKKYWDEKHHRGSWGFVETNGDEMEFNEINIEFEKSLDTNYAIIINKNARGYDRQNAKENAEVLNFKLEQKGDSIIIIPSSIELLENQMFRGQEVSVLIRVPINKFVVLDKNIEEYLDNNEYVSDLRDIDLFGNKLKMTGGGLKPAY